MLTNIFVLFSLFLFFMLNRKFVVGEILPLKNWLISHLAINKQYINRQWCRKADHRGAEQRTILGQSKEMSGTSLNSRTLYQDILIAYSMPVDLSIQCRSGSFMWMKQGVIPT